PGARDGLHRVGGLPAPAAQQRHPLGEPALSGEGEGKERSAAIRSSVAVGLAVSAYGVSFGALAVASGLDVWQTCVLSLLMFSGGSQFALIGVLASGGTAAGVAAISSAVLLGTR